MCISLGLPVHAEAVLQACETCRLCCHENELHHKQRPSGACQCSRSGHVDGTLLSASSAYMTAQKLAAGHTSNASSTCGSHPLCHQAKISARQPGSLCTCSCMPPQGTEPCNAWSPSTGAA